MARTMAMPRRHPRRTRKRLLPSLGSGLLPLVLMVVVVMSPSLMAPAQAQEERTTFRFRDRVGNEVPGLTLVEILGRLGFDVDLTQGLVRPVPGTEGDDKEDHAPGRVRPHHEAAVDQRDVVPTATSPTPTGTNEADVKDSQCTAEEMAEVAAFRQAHGL